MPSNTEIARSAHQAFVNGDWDGFLSHLSPDVRWHGSAIVTGRQSYEGREGVREFLDEVDRLSEEDAARFTSAMYDYEDVDDSTVVAFGRGRIMREHGPLEFEMGAIYRFGDGLITEIQGTTSHEETRKAAGLPQPPGSSRD